MTRLDRWLPAVLGGVSLTFLLLRATIGIDFADDTYPLALARRVAHGAMPLSDEQALHVFGSLPVAPLVAVWNLLVGDTGLVLASRVFTVAWMGVVAVICYRALTTRLPRIPTAIGLCGLLFALPYAVIGTTYNTVAMYLLVLATCATCATMGEDYRRGWVVTAALCCMLAPIAFPGVAPTSVVLLAVLTILLARRHPHRALRDVGGTIGAVLLGFGLYLVLGPGLGTAIDSLAAQRATRSSFTGPAFVQMLGEWVFDHFTQPGKLPLALLASVVAAVLPWRRIAGILAVGAGLLVVLFAAQQSGPNTLTPDDGTNAGFMGILAAVALCPLAVRYAVIDDRYRPVLLVSLTALPATIGVQAMTASGVGFGAAMVGFAPLALAVYIGWGLALREAGGGLFWVAAVIPPLVTASALTAVVIGEGTVFQHRQLVTSGPAAGLWVADDARAGLRTVEDVAKQCPRNARALFVGAPGGYLWVPADNAAMGSWLSLDRVRGIDVDAQKARRATCIVVSRPQIGAVPSDRDNAVLRELLSDFRPAGPPQRLQTALDGSQTVLQTFVPR